MKVAYKRENFTTIKKVVQLGTARYLLWPLYFARNLLTVSGRENLPQRGTPMLIVSNHLSYWDPPVLVIAVDRPMAFVAKEELFDVKYFDKLIEFYGAMSINRGKPEKSAFKSVRQVFQNGWSVAMFVEGTRAKDPGKMGQPHLGAAYFANANKVPILPVGITGTQRRFGKAHAQLGKLIEPTSDLEATTWEIMEALSKLTGFQLPENRVIDA